MTAEIPARAWSVDCGRTSLNGYPCVKAANHDGNHRRFDGKEWPEGQDWRDIIGDFFASQGIEVDDER